MDLPNAPFSRRWSFSLAGVIGLAAITALLGWRGLQVDSVCKRWSVRVLAD